MVQFADLTVEERKTVLAIVDRAVRLYAAHDVEIDALSLDMDLCATHYTCPLRLADLLAADEFNFVHDISGIMRHLNRQTGELGGCFLPRFARPT